mmetsp:Transcript_64662/g.189566  ORF Transcript_64662/g.189566 Transcript_64662/m.189566 type:complete len:685 (-) Transcript_64662:104-2158(-)
MEHALDLHLVCQRLRKALELRNKYTPTGCTAQQAVAMSGGSLPAAAEISYEFRRGLLHLVHKKTGEHLLEPSTSIEEFYDDMAELTSIRSEPSVGTFCFHRLRLLQIKFELYLMSNFDAENEELRSNPHRDFYNVRKVDTHVHHSASMNAKHLLRFIKKKLKSHGDDAVSVEKDGTKLLVKDVFASLGIGWHELSLDKLNVVADQTVFHRFDRFNLKYNPMDQPILRTVFLKTDNEMGGRYLAEITRELLDDLEESKYQHTEWRLSIYGRKRNEWDNLSRWVIKNNLVSPNNQWMIQIPRLYNAWVASGSVRSFQEMLNNIFIPIIEATLHPEQNKEVAEFLSMVSGFDTVDDESKSEKPKDRVFSSRQRTPEDWTISDNPSYKYYNYYLQTNIKVINRLRAARGMTQFSYRPHAGEAGELHHLDTAFLLADSINHGINLRKSMPLQYLYYLCQIGLAMTPCSNNHLFLSYQKTPFHEFYQRGLNVSLGTDDPLQFHQTKEPLMEEYSIAKQFFRLSSSDLCELARNSVLQSGFPDETKRFWVGSADGSRNDITRTNVPDARFKFRRNCLKDELFLINHEKEADMMAAFRAAIPTRELPPHMDSPRRKRSMNFGDLGALEAMLPGLPGIAPEAAEDALELPSFGMRTAGTQLFHQSDGSGPSPKRARTEEAANGKEAAEGDGLE